MDRFAVHVSPAIVVCQPVGYFGHTSSLTLRAMPRCESTDCPTYRGSINKINHLGVPSEAPLAFQRHALYMYYVVAHPSTCDTE
jgi:hypothetical protein